jgi:hypothetical protein
LACTKASSPHPDFDLRQANLARHRYDNQEMILLALLQKSDDMQRQFVFG